MRKWMLVLAVITVIMLAGCNGIPGPGDSPLGPGISPWGGGNDGFDLAAVLEWLLDHVEEAALIAGLAVSLWHGGIKKAEALAVALMLEAEKIAREEIKLGGPGKMAWVLNSFIDNLPPDARAVLRVWAGVRGQSMDDFIADLAQRWYDAAINSSPVTVGRPSIGSNGNGGE